jgi:uncharacterized circularly permuted ATP-grasp superfamily protein
VPPIRRDKWLKDRIIPAGLILGNANYRPTMRGIAVRHKAYVNLRHRPDPR